MNIWLHSTVLAVIIAATAAVGVAGATYYGDREFGTVKKADRLPAMAFNCQMADLSNSLGCGGTPLYVTIEDRSQADQNVSVLIRTSAN